MPIKKTALTIVLITVVALSIAAWVVYNQISAPNVKITAFSVHDHWGNPVGMTYTLGFNVTVENEGVNNVSGLALDFKVFINNSEVHDYDIGVIQATNNFSLVVGEVREFQAFIVTSFSGPLFSRKSTDEVYMKAIVMLGDIVLDEWLEPI